jgi:hypothetical protein
MMQSLMISIVSAVGVASVGVEKTNVAMHDGVIGDTDSIDVSRRRIETDVAMHDAVIDDTDSSDVSRGQIIGFFDFDLASDTDSIDSTRHRIIGFSHFDIASVGVVETDIAIHDAVVDETDSIDGRRRRKIGVFHFDLVIDTDSIESRHHRIVGVFRFHLASVGVVESDVAMHAAVIDSVDCWRSDTNQHTPLVIERINNIHGLRPYKR